MNVALWLVLLMLATQLGAAFPQGIQHWCVVLVGLAAAVLLICRRFPLPGWRLFLLVLVLCGLLLRSSTGQEAMPSPLDPRQLVSSGSDQKPLVIEGRALADAPLRRGRCQALLQVNHLGGQSRDGRTELVVDPCLQMLRKGSLVRAQGQLVTPAVATHPLLPNPAERLADQGCWSQFRTKQVELIQQEHTPLADGRRLIAARFQDLAEEHSGGLLAALVLGGGQVELSSELREAFRVAGLSHALAASGFHLSVLLGATLALTRRVDMLLRLAAGAGAMAVFLALAGGQPSVVRAVLMGATALLIRERGSRAQPLGVLLTTLVLMLLVHPSWARSIGFQLSAAATAGLVLSSQPLEQWLLQLCPQRWMRVLAPALSVPVAALLWTLPLQILHFGSVPLYALVSNLIAAPLLAPLTLSAMILALLTLMLPTAIAALVMPVLVSPVQQLASLLIALVHWISSWPHAQLLTGHPQPWVVLVVVLALLPWALPSLHHWRCRAFPLLLLATLVQASVQLSDELVMVRQWGRQWLLARHQGRAALISSHGDLLSCQLAQQLGHGYGHPRLDWVVVMDPVASDHSRCWTELAHTVRAEHQGEPPLLPGQRLQSPGLMLRPMGGQDRRWYLRVNGQSHRLRQSSGGALRWDDAREAFGEVAEPG
ncbi:ComEC/Rec2 family competence protein [Synechococcus sp. Cu2B8-bc1011]|uniref:ComEC/Rec2 family competence protein n=1 Tax=Synechococcus sp. Cu2B8-bc1011 TaxID=3093725 RepID=UPI0039B01DD7